MSWARPTSLRCGRWPTSTTLSVGFTSRKDGMVGPGDTTMALAKGARQRGARIAEHTKVTGLLTDRGRIVGVTTDRGDIRCQHVVLAAGLWSREFAARHGVTLPLYGAEHFYVVTEVLEGLSRDLPVLRDPDRCAYYKVDAGRLLVGLFEKVARPWPPVGVPTPATGFITLDADTDHLMPLLETAFASGAAAEHHRTAVAVRRP